jgi:hypothetical protein
MQNDLHYFARYFAESPPIHAHAQHRSKSPSQPAASGWMAIDGQTRTVHHGARGVRSLRSDPSHSRQSVAEARLSGATPIVTSGAPPGAS